MSLQAKVVSVLAILTIAAIESVACNGLKSQKMHWSLHRATSSRLSPPQQLLRSWSMVMLVRVVHRGNTALRDGSVLSIYTSISWLHRWIDPMLFKDNLVYITIASLYKLSDAFDWLERSPPSSQNFAVSNNLIITSHPAITAVIPASYEKW